jgi:transposase
MRVRRQAISQDLRDRFLLYIQSTNNASVSAAARTFGLAISTAHSILRRYEKAGTTAVLKRGGARIGKIVPAAMRAIESWVNERPDLTLQAICNKLHEELTITVTKETVSNALTKMKYTIKLLRTIPASRNCPTTVQARLEYAQRFLNEVPADRRNIIWLDESGFNLHLRRKYGRARCGLHANITVANSRGRNISICAAMSEEGLLWDRLRPGAYTADSFCEFLGELFDLLAQMGRENCTLILDNVRFHHCTVVNELAQRHSHTLLFLPPYSPMLNPIESLFGKWKGLIRTQGPPLSIDELLRKMVIARQDITRADCLGWIRDINRNIGLSLQGHIFE